MIEFCRRGRALETARVNPVLDGDMGPGLELQVALLGVLAVIPFKRALDVDRVGIVPFDQVAVVAVHRPHEAGERGEQTVGQGAAEAGALLPQFEGKLG